MIFWVECRNKFLPQCLGLGVHELETLAMGVAEEVDSKDWHHSNQRCSHTLVQSKESLVVKDSNK